MNFGISDKSPDKISSKIINKTLGIIGGGQLGRMICFYAQMMGFRTVIFTNEKDSPASFATNQTIIGEYDDQNSLQKFCELVDFATFEFENIPLSCAQYVAERTKLYPKPEVLEKTQNRILEKKFLQENAIETVDFAAISSLNELESQLKKFQKAILKTAMMGYDGKGQFVLGCESDISVIWNQIGNNLLILEKFCPFDSEISVIVARSTKGEIATYEPLTNIHKNGILNRSIYPAKISSELKIKSQEIASKIAQDIDLVGLMAVEFFVCGDRLLVNELAPRPHNSGHFSMDASRISQFEQLIRAIAGLKLANCDFHSEGEMINLIGDDIHNIEKYLENPLAKIHLYGKKSVKEGRKMGHVNIISPKAKHF